jgi:hypothetical protein
MHSQYTHYTPTHNTLTIHPLYTHHTPAILYALAIHSLSTHYTPTTHLHPLYTHYTPTAHSPKVCDFGMARKQVGGISEWAPSVAIDPAPYIN